MNGGDDNDDEWPCDWEWRGSGEHSWGHGQAEGRQASKNRKANPYNFAKYRRTIRREAQREFAWRQSLKGQGDGREPRERAGSCAGREQPSHAGVGGQGEGVRR